MGRYNDLIDRIDGYEIGTVIIENGVATLGDRPLVSAKAIEVLNGDDYVVVTYESLCSTVSGDGWPLYAGLYARATF